VSSRICNVRTIYHNAPNELESERRFKRAKALGYVFDQRGRAYIPWQPNVKSMRYEKGHLVPRRA